MSELNLTINDVNVINNITVRQTLIMVNTYIIFIL